MKHGFVQTSHGRLHYLEAGKGPSLGKELVAVLPDCGHFPMIDDPALFVKEVNRLLAAVAKK